MSHVKTLQLRNLNSLQAVEDLIRDSRSWHEGSTVVLDCRRVVTNWPNVSVSLAAALTYLREERSIKFLYDHLFRDKLDTRFFSPLPIDTLDQDSHPTNIVFSYSSEAEAQRIADRYMESLTDLVLCEKGVIDTLNWCVYEVLDNVFQHSHASQGFVMMQIHIAKRTCALAISDTGRGIHRAMAQAAEGSSVAPSRVKLAHDAISHALEQGVTSKGKLNQGNGLHGLRRSIEINGGALSVQSGRGTWTLRNGEISTAVSKDRPLLNADTAHGTTIDWRLNCATPVSINEALGRAEQTSALIDQVLLDDGYCRIDAAEIETLIGSRSQGTEVRTRIKNYLNAGAAQVVIDLKGIPLVSSSFADEVMGKLALEMGELDFRRHVFVEGASPVNRGLIERAIELRLNAGA